MQAHSFLIVDLGMIVCKIALFVIMPILLSVWSGPFQLTASLTALLFMIYKTDIFHVFGVTIMAKQS